MNHPQQQESWETRLLEILPLGLDDWIIEEIKAFISTERQRVLDEVREKIEKLSNDWDESGNPSVQLAFHDLLSALKEMKKKGKK